MPPYRANLGGIDGSGVRMPDTRPLIDIGGVIDSASRAFANTREGVLHRALLQQAAAREDQQQKLREAEAANNGTLPLAAAQRLVNEGGFEDESPTPAQGASPPATEMNPQGPDAAPAPAAPTRKKKYSMVDLGNGYATIPELTPGYRQAQMLNTKIDAQGNQITQRGEETRKTEGARQEGRVQLAGDKNDYSLQQIAARGQTAVRTARIRASMKGDPASMSPIQRANLYQKLANNYVGGADGDATEAIAAASHDPHLKEFGVTADELAGYIGSAAIAVKNKLAQGDAAGARSLITSYVEPDADRAVHEAQNLRVKAKAAQGPAKETITSAEAAQLRALGHSDADIASHYTVK